MICRNEPFTLSNYCVDGNLTLIFTIANDVNQAFKIQLIDGMAGVNRTGVMLSFDQIVDAYNFTHNYLRWAGG
jgi:hypothetical protein